MRSIRDKTAFARHSTQPRRDMVKSRILLFSIAVLVLVTTSALGQSSAEYTQWKRLCILPGGMFPQGGTVGGTPSNPICIPLPAPNPEPDRRRDEAREQNEQGVKARNAGNWVLAAQHFKNALDKDPDSELYRNNLAYAERHIAIEEARK